MTIGTRAAIFTTMTVALAFGCSDNSVKVANDNPLGTVGGLVVDAATNMPLPGASVSLLSAGGSFDVMTGPDGFYKLTNVPSGSFTLEITDAMYEPIRVVGNLNGAVGNFPINSPILTMNPYGMVPVGPDFVVQVVDANGQPVNGASATATLPVGYLDLASGSPSIQGVTSVSATTGADGKLAFKGLPDVQKLGAIESPSFFANVAVTVAPIFVMGQTNYQSAGGIFTFNLLNLNVPIAQIELPGPTSQLRVIQSNLEWLVDGFIGPSLTNPVAGSIVETAGPISIAFSEAVDASSLHAAVTIEDGTPGPTVMVTTNLNLVTIAGTFAAGVRYNLSLSATAALNGSGPGRQKVAFVPFFGRPPAGDLTIVSAKTSTNAATPPVTTVTVTLSEPIGLGDGLAQTFGCVAFYENANFDGNSTGPNVQGEWAADPTQLSCSTVSPVATVEPTVANPGTITGTENVGNPMPAPVTGYVTQFTMSYAAYNITATPTMPAAGAMVPAAGGKGHLYFTPLGKPVRRVDGRAVGDIPFTLQ